jgi:hypothetical protein
MASNPRPLTARPADQLETAVRVFTTRKPQVREEPPGEQLEGDGQVRVWRDYPHEALVFDTETLPGPAQQLRFLVWRLYRDAHDRPPAATCVEEGIAYPDTLPTTSPADFELLEQYAAKASADVAPGFPMRLGLRPLSWWLDERLFGYAYAHRDRCALVGFNLLFDLGRLASYWGKAGGAYRGGYSLGLWGSYDRAGRWHDLKYGVRLRLRAIDPRRTLFRWGSRGNDPDPQRGPGRFVDLRTLTFALTDRSLTLEQACAAFGDPYEKQEVDYHQLTAELLDYARADVAHTALLYRNCLAELARHQGVHLEPHRLYSPATVGACYLDAMGVRRPLVKFTGLTEEELGWRQPRQRRHAIDPEEPRGTLDPAVLGYAMSAFYGGRAEARIVRTPVPVVLVDFTSMYPSVNALLDTWTLLTARTVRAVPATEEVRELLAQPDLLDRSLSPDLWRRIGVTLVELEPDGDVLPVRAAYEPADPAANQNGQPAAGEFGIGVNPLSYQGRLWYALPDVIGAVLLSPLEHREVKQPQVKQALRLEPVGTQPGLRQVRLRGGELVDPRRQDPFVRMIEQRQRVRRDTTLDEEERERLDKFLKITANATAYGVLARFDRREPAKPVPVNVYGPDEEPTDSLVPSPEDPGPFCFPPVACSITAAARLMLALLERLVRDKGGQYAFCDTDSMAIVATRDATTIDCPTADGRNAIRTLSWRQLQTILSRFDHLNPYDRTLVASPWKVEQESMTHPLWCYAISAKRYCLYRTSSGGYAELVAAVDSLDESDAESSDALEDLLADWSEHGLGLYLDPTSTDPDRPQRDGHGRRVWVAEAWQWILADAHRAAPPLPAWADRYALTRFTVSSPRLERWFRGFNEGRPRADWIRPGSFGLLAHPSPPRTASTPLPAATYERDPERWPQLEWYDRRAGRPIRVTTISVEHDDPEARAHALERGDVPIQTLSDVLSRYHSRPEHKSLAPDGGPASPEASGLLQRRPLHSSPEETTLIGKEGNKLEERASGEVENAADYFNNYGRRASTWPLVVMVLEEIGAPKLARETEASRQAMYNVLDGALPRRNRRHELKRIAVSHARQRLLEWQIDPPATEAALLRLYTTEREDRKD